jgi:LysM domain
MQQRAPLRRVLGLITTLLTAGVLAAGDVASGILAAVDRLGGSTSAPADVRLTAGLVLLGGLGALLAWCWLLLCAVVALADVLTSRHGLPANSPGPLRPLLLRSLLGVACVGAGAVAVPAHADEVLGQPTRVVSGPVVDVEGLLLPERLTDHGPRPVRDVARTVTPPPSRSTAPPDHERWCTVRLGDSLWGLAEQLLDEGGGAASAGDVDRAWRLLHRANRAALGGDPDLIRPGTVLRVPASLVGADR